MDKIKLVCTDVSQREGYYAIFFQVYNVDNDIYASGNFGVQVTFADGFEIGESYNLKLEKL